ncbi:MAG: InlB B-repeat-containing protein [Bacteroidales bacterium]|nr:InlB B-repeat-containing protein [Bacteroidales bacterium]
MSKTRKTLIVFLIAVAALCMAIAVGAGCGKSKGFEIKFVTGDHAAVSSITAEDGEVITLPTPDEEDGYVFKGWYLTDDYSGNQYSASANFTVTENMTFYGKYNALAPITLNLDGGTLSQTSFSLEEGENVSSYMNDLVPEKARHQFDYWADESGNAISSTLAMPAEGLTLTAVYKVEVSVEVWVWGSGYTDPVHYPEYDMFDYASVGATNVSLSFPTVPTGLTMSSNQGTDGTYILAKVDSDPDKNVLKIYYDAGTLQWACNTNYPEGTGLTSTVWASGEVTFGETVTLPTDVTCYGYLLIGWASYPGATTPEYAVDVVTPNLMVWDSSVFAYVLNGGEANAVTYRPEDSVSTLFAVWARGYVDMFGSYDVVYDTGNGNDTVYLSRGGVFWESETYNASANSYTFRNNYDGSSIYVVRLRSDGYFVFYDRSRSYETRYLVEYSYSGDGGAMTFSVSDTEYFYYTAYDTVEYIINGYSMGIAEYGYNEEGYVVLTFTSGQMTGTVYTIALVEVSYTNGTTVDGYIIRKESEADTKITFGGIGNDENGGFIGYLDGDLYYIALDGFGSCTYYSGSSYYTYRYWLEGDVLTIFSSNYSGGYSYAGEYHYVSGFGSGGRWIYYYEQLDRTFDLYSADGTQVIGSVTLDGLYSGTMTLNGETKNVIFYLTSGVKGTIVVLYSDLDGYGIYYETENDFLYSYEWDSGRGAYNYFLQLIPDTYTESYYFAGISSGLSAYQILAIEATNDTTGKVTLYLYGYSYYLGSYLYFSVWTGDYEIKTDDTYGFSYYLVTNIQTTGEAEYYGITTYYASITYEDLVRMTEMAFVSVTFTSTDGSSTYRYPSNIWYYVVSETDGGERSDGGGEVEDNTMTENRYEEYTGEFEFTLPSASAEGVDGGTLEGEVSLIVIGGYRVFAVMEVKYSEEEQGEQEEKIYFDGYISSYSDYKDMDYETFTVYRLYLEFDYNNTYYSWTPRVMFTTNEEGNGVVETVSEIPYYIFAYVIDPGEESDTEAGLQDDVYFVYDLLAEDGTNNVTFVSGGNEYSGSVETYTNSAGQSTTSTGYTLYKFTGTRTGFDQVSFTFIVASYGSSSDGYFPVFIMYDENSVVKYVGSDGSVFETDGVGLGETGLAGATFTVDGTTYSVSAFVIVDSEDDYDMYGKGYYGNGYIELYANGTYYILDLLGSEDAAKGNCDYTVRGQEYWYTFFVVDNQIIREYLVTFDGYGEMEVWFYDEAESGYVIKGTGTYEIVDTVVTFGWSYTGGQGGSDTTYTGEGEIASYSGYYAYIFINRSEFVSRLVNSQDFSVVVLDAYGYATRYLTDGSIEYGYYTILDDNYFYYLDADRTTEVIYEYSFSTGIILPAEYDDEDVIYYSSDMTQSVYLSKTGTLTVDGSNYYYYVKSGQYIYVYYPSDSESANKYGYSVSGPVKLDETLTVGNDTYYKEEIGAVITLGRDSSGASKYGYVVYTTDTGTGDTTKNVYTLGTISFSVAGNEFEASGNIYAALQGSDTTMTVYVYRTYSAGEGKYVMQMAMDCAVYSYADFFLYDIEVDLATNTYKITSMALYMPMYSGDYIYCLYLSDYYYMCYEYAYYYYTLGYGDEWYYYAEEYYYLSYYYYFYSPYYYSYMYLIWNCGENCDLGEEMYAAGYFMPYLLSDTEGNMFYYEAEVEIGSNGYYIEFVGEDGYTYSLTFLLDSEFMEERYCDFYVYVVVMFEGHETYETKHSDSEDYYTVDAGYILFSDYYESGYIGSMKLTKYTYDGGLSSYGEGETVDGLTTLTINGNIYLVSVEYDDATGEYNSSTYYKIEFVYDEEEGKYYAVVSIFTGVTSYTTGSGHIDIFRETKTDGDGNTNTFDGVVLVCFEETNEGDDTLINHVYYYVTSSVKNSDGTYTITLSNGSVYTVALDESNNTATMTLIDGDDELGGDDLSYAGDGTKSGGVAA